MEHIKLKFLCKVKAGRFTYKWNVQNFLDRIDMRFAIRRPEIMEPYSGICLTREQNYNPCPCRERICKFFV